MLLAVIFSRDMAINSETEAGLGKSQNMSAYLWQISVGQVNLRGNRGLKWSRMGGQEFEMISPHSFYGGDTWIMGGVGHEGK